MLLKDIIRVMPQNFDELRRSLVSLTEQAAPRFLTIAYATATGSVDPESDLTLCTNGAAITLTMPDATTRKGRVYTIKRISNFNVTIQGVGAQRVDDYVSETLTTYRERRTYVSDGANWWRID